METSIIRRIECLSKSLQPFSASVFDEQQRCIWEVTQERPSSGFLRFTKFRMMMELLLKMKGVQGCYWIRRKVGFFLATYTIEQPEGRAIWNIRHGFNKYEIKDQWQRKVGECSFSNPLILGQDRGVVKVSNNSIAAEVVLNCGGFFYERWKGEITLYSTEWEVLTVALTAIRITLKQQR